jgi:hypothetical protein
VKDHLREIVDAAAPGQAQNAMREYLQARTLEALQRAGAWASLTFMGGTALRFLYRTPRFSEDLDFSLEGDPAVYDFERLLGAVRRSFEREGYEIRLRPSTSATVHKAFVRFPGLLREMSLSTDPEQAFSIKIEVDTNPPAGAGIVNTTVRRFVTLRISHHDKPSLLAGKIAALLLRGWVKGRDVYDLVWYLSDPEWPEPNAELLANALRQAGQEDLSEPDAWQPALAGRLREAPWDGVPTDVERFLERPEDCWMLERDTVLSVLEQRGWA